MLLGKMKTKLKYATTAVIALILGFMGTLGVDIVDEQPISYDQGYIPYSCDVEGIDDYMCYKLSRVGETTGVNRNCYYNRDRGKKYKVCSTGWKRIINTDDCPENKVQVIAYIPNDDCTETEKWFCDGFGRDAECVMDNSLELPVGW